jgi:hypothetical protein
MKQGSIDQFITLLLGIYLSIIFWWGCFVHTYQNETGRRASSRLRSMLRMALWWQSSWGASKSWKEKTDKEVDESSAQELMGKCNRKAAQMVTYRIIHNMYIYIVLYYIVLYYIVLYYIICMLSIIYYNIYTYILYYIILYHLQISVYYILSYYILYIIYYLLYIIYYILYILYIIHIILYYILFIIYSAWSCY